MNGLKLIYLMLMSLLLFLLWLPIALLYLLFAIPFAITGAAHTWVVDMGRWLSGEAKKAAGKQTHGRRHNDP